MAAKVEEVPASELTTDARGEGISLMAIVLDNITYTYGMGTPFEKTALHVYLLLLKMVNF